MEKRQNNWLILIMFKQRLLTALVLIPLVLLAIKLANAWVLGVLMLVFLIAAGGEWLKLIPLKKRGAQGLFLLLLCVCIGLCSQVFQIWLGVGLITWGLITLAILTYPASQAIWGKPWVVGGVCWLLLPLVGSASKGIYQQPHGSDLIIYLFFLVWSADSGAYLVGKKWGAHRLIPQVSPGKTVEGALGGFFLGMLVAGLGAFWFSPESKVVWFGLAVSTVLIAIVGDLFISMLKRRSQIKDTGTLFPGHGGVLDRLDSFIAAAPVFYAGLCFCPIGGG